MVFSASIGYWCSAVFSPTRVFPAISVAVSYFTTAHLINRPSSLPRSNQRQHRNQSPSPTSSPPTSSTAHPHSHAPTSASIATALPPSSPPAKDRSSYFLWYSVFPSVVGAVQGFSPQGFFPAISVPCRSRVRAYVFPHFEEGSRCSLDPLSLAQFWNLCYYFLYFIVCVFFSVFDHVTVRNGIASVCMSIVLVSLSTASKYM